jgi:hypothetical protein
MSDFGQSTETPDLSCYFIDRRQNVFETSLLVTCAGRRGWLTFALSGLSLSGDIQDDHWVYLARTGLWLSLGHFLVRHLGLPSFSGM